METRINSIVFDRKERSLRATIRTASGTVKVQWSDVCGDWCWMTSCTLDAKALAVPTIERIQHLLAD